MRLSPPVLNTLPVLVLPNLSWPGGILESIVSLLDQHDLPQGSFPEDFQKSVFGAVELLPAFNSLFHPDMTDRAGMMGPTAAL